MTHHFLYKKGNIISFLFPSYYLHTLPSWQQQKNETRQQKVDDFFFVLGVLLPGVIRLSLSPLGHASSSLRPISAPSPIKLKMSNVYVWECFWEEEEIILCIMYQKLPLCPHQSSQQSPKISPYSSILLFQPHRPLTVSLLSPSSKQALWVLSVRTSENPIQIMQTTHKANTD